MDREIAIDAPMLPPALRAGLDGYRWFRDTVGESDGAVYRLSGTTGRPDLYLKHGRGAVANDVTDETARLIWLGEHLPVPRLHQFIREPGGAWLLSEALAGQTAYECLESSCV